RFAGLPAIAGASRCCRPALSWRQEKKERDPSWPISFANTGRVTVRRIAYQPPTERSCGPLRSVAPRSWEVISKSATLAALSTRAITPAVTATVPNASHWPKLSGWRSKPLSFCRWAISIWSFTLPHEFNRLILAHKKILLAFLFKAVSETLLEFGQRRFGATMGIIAVLHTWDQTLKDHFHLHCLVPAGALSLDQSR